MGTDLHRGPVIGEGRYLIRVLQVDPELGAGLDAPAFAVARDSLLASVVELRQGPWEPHTAGVLPTGAKLLLLDGLLVRALVVGGHSGVEILGSGDLVQPGQPDREHDMDGLTEEWRVLVPGRAAILDRTFIAAAARFPTVVAELIERAAERATRVAIHTALAQSAGIGSRVWLLLWSLAQRWGKVGPGGVLLHLPMSHQALAELVGACRTSVTMAVNELVREGLLERPSRALWLLRGPAPVVFNGSLDGPPSYARDPVLVA